MSVALVPAWKASESTDQFSIGINVFMTCGYLSISIIDMSWFWALLTACWFGISCLSIHRMHRTYHQKQLESRRQLLMLQGKDGEEQPLFRIVE